jgi:putative mRNA 3-end processing factor
VSLDGDLIVERPEGLYCPPGDFYIDPWRAVERAVITHAHADHARAGHRHVLATARSEPVLRARLGRLSMQGLSYGERVHIHGVQVSLHPAGHVLGSAQVRLEHRGRVWVVSGDYFVSLHDEINPTCEPFEPVRCDCFVTESTFGLPLYRWQAQASTFAQINAWWRDNARNGRASVLAAYSFGKAQHLLAGVDASIGPIAVHASVATMNDACRAAGLVLPSAASLADAAHSGTRWAGALVIAPPQTLGGEHAAMLAGASRAFASGWTQLRRGRQRRGYEQGFVLSDHADWPGLQRAIRATEAERVIVTHGKEAVMVRWLREQGLRAGTFRTPYGEADDDSMPAAGAGDAQ